MIDEWPRPPQSMTGAESATGAVSLISSSMREAVGAVVEWKVSFAISASDIRRWMIAVSHPDAPPREFWDEEYAEHRTGGIVAPDEFNPFAWMVAAQSIPAIEPLKHDTDRIEKAIGIVGPGLVNQIKGGNSAVYGALMRPGDVIRSETSLVEYRERRGRFGLMLFTITEAVWANQRGELVRTARDTSIRY